MAERWLLTGLLAAVLLVTVISPASVARLTRSLFVRVEPERSEFAQLEREVIALRAEVAAYKVTNPASPLQESDYTKAVVYSRYPFNFKSEMAVDVGSDRGVAANTFVVVVPDVRPTSTPGAPPFLLGKVSSVGRANSIITTIFDGRYQVAVRIGSAGVDALYNGGTVPQLTLIDKAAHIEKGDVIYAASPDLPYGLPVGEVASVDSGVNMPFAEAAVAIPYDINAVRVVYIRTNK